MVRLWQGCAIALILLAVAGCTKTPRSTPAAAPSQPAQTTSPSSIAPPSSAPAGAVKPQASGPNRTIALAQEQPPAATPAAARLSSDVSSLLPVGRGSRVLPEDFKIGVLGDSQVGDADERQAMVAASAFLSRLLAGKVEAALLAASTGGRITDMLEFGIRRGGVPSAFRVGTPKKHESGEISASVRLFSEAATTEGEISLARTEGHWLVADFQISLDDLQVKREKSRERFFPSSYRWLLQE